jgi:dethiobiotin synthetase
MPAFFITGAGTDIGKTYVTAALARQIRAAGGRVGVLKPVVSGVAPLSDAAFAASDTAVLLQAAGLSVDEAHVLACSPWRFAAALAPDRAAALEGCNLDIAEITGWCRARLAEAASDQVTLVEGAGGLMSPVTREATVLDWMKALNLPAILVAGSYLGAISHALTAIEVVRASGLGLRAVVVSESVESAGLAETVEALNRFAPAVEVISLPRGGTILGGLAEP